MQPILSGFCALIDFAGFITLCLNFRIKASVSNTYISHVIFAKLSQNASHQVPQGINLFIFKPKK